jgi:hypothetical protein
MQIPTKTHCKQLINSNNLSSLIGYIIIICKSLIINDIFNIFRIVFIYILSGVTKMANRQWSDFINGISSKFHPKGIMEQDYKQRFQSLKDVQDSRVSDYPHKSHGMFDEYAHISDSRKGKRTTLDGQDGRELEYSKANIIVRFVSFIMMLILAGIKLGDISGK